MPSRRRPRTTLSVRVRTDLAARLREYVRDNAGKPLYLNMSGFFEAAIERHIAALERELAGEAPTRRRTLDNNRT
jgi:hypothetical protein